MSSGTAFSSILVVVLSLGFVLLLAWGGLWMLRRLQDGQLGPLRRERPGRVLRFTRTMPLGQRERLVLVEIDGEELLLGVTAHTIVKLKSWQKLEGTGTTDMPPAERPRFDMSAIFHNQR